MKQDDINLSGDSTDNQPVIRPNGPKNPTDGMFIFDPKLIDGATAVSVTPWGLVFANEGKSVAVWSPISVSGVASQVPCVGNLRGPLIVWDNVLAAMDGYLLYLNLLGSVTSLASILKK